MNVEVYRRLSVQLVKVTKKLVGYNKDKSDCGKREPINY